MIGTASPVVVQTTQLKLFLFELCIHGVHTYMYIRFILHVIYAIQTCIHIISIYGAPYIYITVYIMYILYVVKALNPAVHDVHKRIAVHSCVHTMYI